MLGILGWVVWAAVLVIAAALTFGFFRSKTATHGTVLTIVALWLELSVFLVRPEWSKLHLLWLVAATFPAMTFISVLLTLNSRHRE